jgi:dihydrofolate reductase
MGKIIVSEFISLDNVVETPGGDGDYRHAGWTDGISSGEEGTMFKYRELMEAEAQLLGRRTYEGFAAAWPGMEAETGDFGKKMNEMPKYVISSTLEDAAWKNSAVLGGDAVEEVRSLKDRVDGVILVGGSSQLVHTLIEHDLVDELRLMVHPVILGSGRRLFADSEELKRLHLASAEVMGDVVLLVYTATT